MRFADGTRMAYELGRRIGGGAEGDVYELAEDAAYCAKIYREPRADLRDHIEALMTINSSDWHRHGEGHLQVAWPFGIAEDAAGQATGFFMYTLRDQYLLAQDLFSVRKRAQKPFLNWGYNVGVAADLAWMVGKLHAGGMLVCDLALENLAFSPSGRVEFLDCDSFLFSSGRRTYGGVHWREDYSPSEGGSGRHTGQTDYFSLAVVICRLLLEEFSPFAGIDTLAPSDDDRSPKANISRGRSWLFHPEIRTTRGCPPPWLLPASLRELARSAFEKGSSAPSARPTPEDWYRALARVGRNLRHCGRSPQHVYDAGDTLSCPWCDRRSQLDGQDPFPCPDFASPTPTWLQVVAQASIAAPAPWPWHDPVPADAVVRVRDAGDPYASDPYEARHGRKHAQNAQHEGKELNRERLIWSSLEQAYENGDTIPGTVTGVAKGGLTIDIGRAAFLPEALIDTKPTDTLESFVGRKVTARIVHLSEDFIVLSQRKVLEHERAQDRQTLIGSLRVGQVIVGRVKRIVTFGAFIDLGGIDGLVHVSEFPGGRPANGPGDILKVGQEVTAEVLSVDTEQQRVSLSLKKTIQDDSWDQFARTHYVGQFVHGKVKKIMPYGAFVTLGSFDGLLHVSNMSEGPVTDPGTVVKVGDQVRVKIVDIDANRQRVSLSLKELG
jgi:predicted RNA-binding protein with RPS1 domain